MRHISLLCIAVVFFALTACEEPEFDPGYELGDDPLMLALVVTPPWGHAGERLTLEPLVHWPHAQVSSLYLRCIPEEGQGGDCMFLHAPDSFSDVPTCDASPDARLCMVTGDASPSFVVPPWVIIPDDVAPIFIYVAASNQEDPAAACGETLLKRTPTASCLVSTKIVLAAPDEWLGQNPRIEGFSVDGVAVDATAVADRSQEVHIALTLDASSITALTWGETGSPVSHHMNVAFYTDCGEMDYLGETTLMDENPYVHNILCTNPGDIVESYCEPIENTLTFTTDHSCVIHAVVRDNMAGMAYKTLRIE